MNKKLLSKILNLASSLDKKGLYSYANQIDLLIRTSALDTKEKEKILLFTVLNFASELDPSTNKRRLKPELDSKKIARQVGCTQESVEKIINWFKRKQKEGHDLAEQIEKRGLPTLGLEDHLKVYYFMSVSPHLDGDILLEKQIAEKIKRSRDVVRSAYLKILEFKNMYKSPDKEVEQEKILKAIYDYHGITFSSAEEMLDDFDRRVNKPSKRKPKTISDVKVEDIRDLSKKSSTKNIKIAQARDERYLDFILSILILKGAERRSNEDISNSLGYSDEEIDAGIKYIQSMAQQYDKDYLKQIYEDCGVEFKDANDAQVRGNRSIKNRITEVKQNEKIERINSTLDLLLVVKALSERKFTEARISEIGGYPKDDIKKAKKILLDMASKHGSDMIPQIYKVLGFTYTGIDNAVSRVKRVLSEHEDNSSEKSVKLDKKVIPEPTFQDDISFDDLLTIYELGRRGVASPQIANIIKLPMNVIEEKKQWLYKKLTAEIPGYEANQISDEITAKIYKFFGKDYSQEDFKSRVERVLEKASLDLEKQVIPRQKEKVRDSEISKLTLEIGDMKNNIHQIEKALDKIDPSNPDWEMLNQKANDIQENLNKQLIRLNQRVQQRLKDKELKNQWIGESDSPKSMTARPKVK